MTGPGTDHALLADDDYENGVEEESEQDDRDDYGADDDWPAEVCHPLYDGG